MKQLNTAQVVMVVLAALLIGAAVLWKAQADQRAFDRNLTEFSDSFHGGG